MTTEKTDMINSERENTASKRNRDFERHGIYTPRNLKVQYGTDKERAENSNKRGYGDYDAQNKFKFKNSLVITPHYEIEFNAMGGIKCVKNHEDRVFFTNDGIFATTNGIQKIPILIKRGVNKLSVQKKLIVEEKYNYEEKYEIYKNIILYYEENRIDFQILFNKLDSNQNPKDITTEFSLNLSIPGIDDIITYKKYDEKQEYRSLLSKMQNSSADSEHEDSKTVHDSPFEDNIEYVIVKCGKHGGLCMTVYPDKRQQTRYKNKSLCFAVPNVSQPQKNYINLKIYLENLKIT